ncbi:MAG TPA: SGNH/GDSL hydrolase family protein [Fulvivirga sp.]|nr:SGNH/GDSL hydrolase family protein [Fulvivirga sp.]
MSLRSYLFYCFCCLVLLTGKSEEKPFSSNILFVGNSLTYTNDLPKLIQEIGKEKGNRIKYTSLTLPNYALEDHWNEGQLQDYIKSEKFDFVIVQQGPSSQPEGRTMLFEYGQLIKTLCDNHNTKLAFYMVWPSRTYYHTFDGVIQNYTEASLKTQSILCPVGKVWKAHFDQTNDFSYYGPDGFHPSLKGSKVAAKIIYESLF